MLVSKESYEQMYRADPNSWRVHQALAQSFVERERLDEPVRECQQAISLQPQEPGLHEVSPGRCEAEVRPPTVALLPQVTLQRALRTPLTIKLGRTLRTTEHEASDLLLFRRRCSLVHGSYQDAKRWNRNVSE
jgi:hypothetical protein